MSAFSSQAIAVLGLACRFPGADSPERFWKNLANGVESVQEVPATRWSVDQCFAPPPYQPGKSVSKWGGFLADIRRFDAAFFGIARAEAQVMDPQQRILLELAHETLERSGYTDQRRTRVRVGVFLGVGQNGYSELMVPLLRSGQPTHPMLVAHNIRNLVAGQIAHSLNLTGPALVIDTACSSSLVALHMARQSLLAGDCDLALVGGINLNITATPFVAFSSAGVLAASPHTYVFDERADGFVLGEGGGMVLLSTLAHATAAQDPILGIIQGSAVNNDGRSLGAITPSPGGQAAVLRAAYATANISPDSIAYLEAHGTATRIGDLVEARALTRFFPEPPLSGVRYLGSVKPNVGHLLSAAAMPSLIKVLLAFHHRQLPPTLHGEQPRVTLNLARAGLTINRTLIDWTPTAPGQPLRAGVSSFGFGGTNAHIILEEPPQFAPRRLAPPIYHFAHTPHWVEAKRLGDLGLPLADSKREQQTATIASPTIAPVGAEWFQRLTWTAAPLVDQGEAGGTCTHWLLLTVATAAAQQLARLLRHQLEEQGFPCIIQLCTAYEGKTLDFLLAQNGPTGGVVLIGPVGHPCPLDTRAALDSELEQGLFTLHAIGQRLLAMTQRPAGFWVITAGAYTIPQAATAVAPERAALAGLAFALNDESTDLPCCVVDLPPVQDLQALVTPLLTELRAGPRRARVAWRELGNQWARLGHHLTTLGDQAASPPLFQPARHGAYLITGGASGIGAALARSLAAQGVPLVLTGRTPLTRAPERAALVIALRKQGTTVEYVVADITQPPEVTALIDYVCHLYGGLGGVIHAAGVVHPQALRHQSRANMEAVLAPKVVGAWLLAQELQRRALRPACFVLCSSIAAVLPGLSGGLSDYAAANAFLDALAATERARGVACTALNWSLWTETGIGAQPVLLQHLVAKGITGLTTDEGVAAFYQALALDEAQVVVCKQTSAAPVNQPPSKALNAAPLSVTRHPPAATANVIEQTLQTLLATVLKVEPASVAKDASFMGLGIDSMDALDLVQKLEQQGFGTLPATLFFEYQTITELAHYLVEQASTVAEHVATIPPAPATDLSAQAITFPLSATQRAFAIHACLYPERPAVAFLRQTIQGELQLPLLQQAVTQVAAHHPLLRARFFIDQLSSDQPQQTIYPATTPALIPAIEVSATGIANAAELDQLEERTINRPFDLEHETPWRLVLTRDHRQLAQWHLLLAIHHIAGDAWSLSLVAQALWAVYTALVQGERVALPPATTTFQAYVANQQSRPMLDSVTQTWWRQQLARYAPALPIRLPFDHAPAAADWVTTRHVAHVTRLTSAQTAALSRLAAQHNLSLFHLVLAIYLRCLHNWSEQAFLIINVADAQRPTHLPGIMQVVGSFADTLPLGLPLDRTESVLALAQRVRQHWLDIQKHKAISSDVARLLAAVVPSQQSDQPHLLSPLGFSFARFTATLPTACPVDVVEIFGRTATPATQLSLVGWEFVGALHFSWNYRSPLFTAATIEALADHFVREVTQLVTAQQPAEEVEQNTSAEDGTKRALIPATFSAPSPALVQSQTESTPPPDFVSLHALVQAQCRHTPDAMAVWAEGGALTYADLDQHSAQVAAALSQQGIRQGDTVGLLAQPSAAAVILLLGIVKAGAAWVPLDPAHPPARHADQLQQAGTRLLVYPPALTEAAATIREAMPGSVQEYALEPLCQTPIAEPPTLTVTAAQLAYIIFTSGSTGRPKGVPITHGALANYLGWAVATFGYGPDDRVMQATSLCFDASIRQILAPLITGGTVVPVTQEQTSDPETLLNFVQQTQITIWSSAPVLWARLLGVVEQRVAAGMPAPAFPHLRWIQVGGEALSAQFVRRWLDCYGDQHPIVNLYGPTESTINATYYIVPERPAAHETQIPIGYPVRGATLQIVDETGAPCPIGGVGELWIGGAGLSPGYLQDAQRTQERFVQTATDEIFYRSGDRVQQRADGALRFLGRLDDQVKVRGYRIEVGEIEAILGQQPGVRLAAVITRRGEDEQELIAYVECTEPSPTEAALRQWLRNRLPDYMLPHHIYRLDQLPQMPNGKIDRQRLSDGAVDAVPLPQHTHGTTPQTVTEQQLARIWQAVLRRSPEKAPIAREDDFFTLGGDSLQAIRVFVELGKARTGLPSAAYLYRYRTLAALAQAIDQYQHEPSAASITADPMDDHFGVSLSQAGFLLMRTHQKHGATSWCAYFCLEGPLQPEHFRQAVQVLVERHLMLRVVFPAAGSAARTESARQPQQYVIQPSQPLPVLFTDWQTLSMAEQQAALAARWNTLRARQFDPTQWPLIEMQLCRLTPVQHIWFVATDHLIGDGLSGWLLGQELLQVYDALVQGYPPSLPPLRSTFRDYITLQQQREQSADPAAEQHWRQVFATPYQSPNLRAKRAEDRTLTPLDDKAGWTHEQLAFAAPLVQRLEEYAAGARVTLYELLLTFFLCQLHHLTGQTDLVVGSAIAGRDEPLPDIMRIFGAFASVLPIRVHLDGAAWQTYLQQVNTAFTTARAHTLSPRRIAQLMHPQTPFTAAIGAQFLFSYMDFAALGPLQSNTLHVQWERSQTELQPPSMGTDLVLTGRKLDGQLRLHFAAPAAVLTAAQMHTFVEGFRQALHTIAHVQDDKPFSPSFTSTPLERTESTHLTPRLDAALIGYLPPLPQIQALLGPGGQALDAHTVRRLLFPEQRPRWLERLETPLGVSGLIAIPRFADELPLAHMDALRDEVMQAIQQAARLGARCVSLAGMLPAHTRYGYALLDTDNASHRPALTTGHSTTVVAVVKSVIAALAATGRTLATQTVGCLGIGSIGSAALQLLLSVAGQPAGLLLCDVTGSAERLHALVTTLRQELDYQGKVRIIAVDNALPTEFYQADLIIGATSRPQVLDVTQLAPGTVVIDDSFPACFDVDQAIERMTTAQDVLLAGGGLLNCGSSQHTIYLPWSNAALSERIAGQLHPNTIASCQLEALLWTHQPALPLTQGTATLAGALAYWAAAQQADIMAAPLHLREFQVDTSLTRKLQQR